MFKFISHKTQMVLAASCIVAALSISAFQTNAQAAPGAEYYKALEEASTLKSRAHNIAGSINNYNIPASYCEPPLMPQKPLAKRALDGFGTQKRSVERKVSALSYIAVDASMSQYASTYAAQIQEVLESQMVLADATSTLTQKNAQHSDTPVVDCSDITPSTSTAVPTPQAAVSTPTPTNLIKDWHKKAGQLKARAENFVLYNYYCLPPEKPNKPEHRDKLNNLMRQINYQRNRLRMLFMNTNGENRSMVLTSSLILIGAEGILNKKRDKLDAATELECKKTKTSHYIPSETPSGPSQDDLKYALANAMGNSPYSQTRVVALPSASSTSANLMHDAEYALDARTRAIRAHYAWQRMNERNRPYVSPTESETAHMPIIAEDTPEPITITATPTETQLKTPMMSLDTASKDLPEYKAGYPIKYERINRVSTSIGSDMSIPSVTGDAIEPKESVFNEIYNPLGIAPSVTEQYEPAAPLNSSFSFPNLYSAEVSRPIGTSTPSYGKWSEPLPTNTLE